MPFDATAWKQAATGSRDLEAPPDAIYDAELAGVAIVTKREDGRQWLKLTWRVISGRERDAQWSSLHTLDAYKLDGEPNPGLSFTVQALQKMEIATEARTDAELEQAVAAHQGQAFAVEVKRSGSFTNTYPQRRLVGAAASLPGTGGYGEPAGPGNAILGADELTSQRTTAELAGRAPERTGESDVPSEGKFTHPPQKGDVPWTPSEPIKRGDLDPETGEPIPF